MVEGDFKYRAFLSYSKTDSRAAQKLLRQLERFIVPKRLRPESRKKQAHLRPIFRDREELPSSNDLGAALRGKLAESEHLIVLCSPNSARSKWVNQEVLDFRALGRGSVLAVIIDGEPHSGGADECFPPALARTAEAETLAADFRPTGDGPRIGLLKLVAGLLGVGLDDLQRRHRAQQMQRTALAVTGALGLLAFTYVAVQVGTEGRIQSAVESATRDTRLRAERDRLGAAAATLLEGQYTFDNRLDSTLMAMRAGPDRNDTDQYLPESAEAVLRKSGLLILPTRIDVVRSGEETLGTFESAGRYFALESDFAQGPIANRRIPFDQLLANSAARSAFDLVSQGERPFHPFNNSGIGPNGSGFSIYRNREAVGEAYAPAGCSFTGQVQRTNLAVCIGLNTSAITFFDADSLALVTYFESGLNSAYLGEGEFRQFAYAPSSDEISAHLDYYSVLTFDADSLRQLSTPRQLFTALCANVARILDGVQAQLQLNHAMGPNTDEGYRMKFEAIAAMCQTKGF